MCVSVVKYNGSASKISLTESLSALEGKSEALGAGAKIIANYSGMLPEKDILRLEKSNTEIILFSDGYEHGNTEMDKNFGKTHRRFLDNRLHNM
mgnify:CR=1 FL=1